MKGIDITVAEGEIFGFLGPSGAGKSTTQKILIALLRDFTGEVSVLGNDPRRSGPSFYERIGVGFELPNHYPKLTALENLQLFASFYAKRTRDPRELLGLVGLEDHADKRAEELSKGMKMRLNFVRALLHEPELLFLDEPTSGLDPGHARTIKKIIVEQKEAGRTVFLTTHNMHDAEELCDRVAFLVDGEVKLVDSPKALRARKLGRSVVVEYLDGEVQRREFPLEGVGVDPELLTLLRDREIVSLHSQEPTLEDVFVEVTGRRLS